MTLSVEIKFIKVIMNMVGARKASLGSPSWTICTKFFGTWMVVYMRAFRTFGRPNRADDLYRASSNVRL